MKVTGNPTAAALVALTVLLVSGCAYSAQVPGGWRGDPDWRNATAAGGPFPFPTVLPQRPRTLGSSDHIPAEVPEVERQAFYAAFADVDDATDPGMLEVTFELPVTPPIEYTAVEKLSQEVGVTYLAGRVTNTLSPGTGEPVDGIDRIVVHGAFERDYTFEVAGPNTPALEPQIREGNHEVRHWNGAARVSESVYRDYEVAWAQLQEYLAVPGNGPATGTRTGESRRFLLVGHFRVLSEIEGITVEGSRGRTHAVPVAEKDSYTPSNSL